MVAEIVQTLRFLSQPLRRQFWWRSTGANKNSQPDQAGVVLLSFSQLSQREQAFLANRLRHRRRQNLSDGELPALPLSEHLEVDTLQSALYRCVLFVIETIGSWRPLLKGQLPWSQHLKESEDLARLQTGVMSGCPYLHLSSRGASPGRLLRRVGAFLRGQEKRRYELWVIDRQARVAYLPSSLLLPKEALSSEELGQLARSHSCLKERRKDTRSSPKETDSIRLMSYNLHSCIGLDGRLSVERIAEVLHRCNPDFVAFQEMDRGTTRSQGRDQLRQLQELWPSEGAFLPLLQLRGGQYGIGFLSRLPILDWESTLLPRASQLLPQEPRGLLRVRIALPHRRGELELFNTHLGLTQKERLAQLSGVLSLVEESTSPHRVLLGDFNCSPKSEEYARLCQHLRPAQSSPEKTWFGTFPLRQLDYCFLSKDLTVLKTEVPRDSHSRIASDHLPLIVDIRLADFY